MLSQIRIDRRVLYSFMILMLAVNAAVLFVSWNEIMAGKNDFPVFYSNAQMVREGQAARLYDFDAENSFGHRVSNLVRPPNNHLPYELLVFVPFGRLQFGAAYMLWTLLSLGMLAGVALLLRSLGSMRSQLWLTFLTTLAFFPVWYCLGQGQDSILLLFLFALSFWFCRRGQDDTAGLVLAFGLFRLQLVLPFVLVAFLGGRWKFVRGFAPGAVLAILASAWVVGLHGMTDYVRILMSQGTQGSASTLAEHWRVHPGLMPTLRGLLWTLPSWVPSNIRNFLLLSGTLGALMWAGRRMRNARDAAAFDRAFAVAVTVVTLVSFHSFVHDFSLMILPLLIAGDAVATWVRVGQTAAYAIVTLGFLFFFSPLYLVLIFTDEVGLFVIPTVTFLYFLSSWEMGDVPKLVSERHVAEPVSLPTV